jgi:uncharacterized protein with HEPN domain
MRPEARALLYDMQEACNLIHSFTGGKQYDDYAGDIVCQSAVERQFITLGEALNRLVRLAPEIADQIPARRDIINFRNLLAHGYDKVEVEVVWGIVRKYLPELRHTLTEMMRGKT